MLPTITRLMGRPHGINGIRHHRPPYLGNRLLRLGFRIWFLFMFNKVENKEFSEEPIHEDLFNIFQSIYDNEIDRQIINIPPRSAKTTMAIYFIAYCLARNSRCNFIYTSYSQELLSDNARRLAKILKDQLYIDMYSTAIGEVETQAEITSDFWRRYYHIDRDSTLTITARRITTAAGGTVLFNSIGSAITGFGAGIAGENRFSGAIIIDDAQKPIEAYSERLREKVKTYFSETLLSRLNNSKTPIVNYYI